MKLNALIITIGSVGLALGAVAGNITGTVKAEGKSGTQAAASDGKYDSRKFKFVERINYDELRDFVIYIDGPIAGQTNSPKTLSVDTRRVSQKGAVFVPHVLPVVVGTKVEWPN